MSSDALYSEITDSNRIQIKKMTKVILSHWFNHLLIEKKKDK